MKPTLGTLTRIDDLRAYWKHEASDFTPWLADPLNLRLIGDAIGVTDFQSIQTEQDAGDFLIDIVAQTDQDELVIIENQLEPTNHRHLGQLITYASGRNAKFIVWIAKKLRDEHREALQWLNSLANDSTNKVGFWGIEIELWRIDDSQPAPRLNVVVQPNNWTRSVAGDAESSATHTLQYEFWTKFKEFCEHKKCTFKLQQPRPQQWSNISIGRSDFTISATVKISTNEVGCALYVRRPTERPRQARVAYDKLISRRAEIEATLGQSLIWPAGAPEDKAWRIVEYREANLRTTEEWQLAFEWLASRITEFQRIFGPMVAQLNLEESTPATP